VNRVRASSFSILIFRLAILAVAGWGLLPKAGWPQGFVSGEFNLTREVRWVDTALPMGDYDYFVESNQWPYTVRVEQKGGEFKGAFIPASFLRRDHIDNGGVILTTVGGETYVTSIRLPSLGGEIFFPAPGSAADGLPTEALSVRRPATPAVDTREFITILNPNHEKFSAEQAEKVYLRVCEAVQKEFSRPLAVHPHLTLRLGAGENVLRYPTREILLKKWDEYRFADAVVDLVLFDMVPRDERVKLGNIAVTAARSTVSVCELKDCAK
jgi:hypothetical protein